VRHIQPLALGTGQGVFRVPQSVLHRTEHEGEGGAELVADIAEEQGLGAVYLRQGLGPPALLFIGACAGNGGGHMTGNQLEEAAIIFVEGLPGADTQDEKARMPSRPCCITGCTNAWEGGSG
jgi:hypothetical protein